MVTHAVLEHTHLLYGRHLDQLLLSALYGVAKVHALRQVTFKDIIAHYKRQPQARTPIFRTVAIALTDPDLQARARPKTLTLPSRGMPARHAHLPHGRHHAHRPQHAGARAALSPTMHPRPFHLRAWHAQLLHEPRHADWRRPLGAPGAPAAAEACIRRSGVRGGTPVSAPGPERRRGRQAHYQHGGRAVHRAGGAAACPPPRREPYPNPGPARPRRW
jgi:hypothetical protein